MWTDVQNLATTVYDKLGFFTSKTGTAMAVLAVPVAPAGPVGHTNRKTHESKELKVSWK